MPAVVRAGFPLLVAAAVAANADSYRPADIVDWKTRQFGDATVYELVDRADGGPEHAAVRARCEGGNASALVLEQRHRLADAPMLEWRWRVDSMYRDLDERQKSGDDFPARVYVVSERWPDIRSRAISYVWSRSEPAGSSWESPYADQFMMVSVRSGERAVGQWITERRNVLEDFARLHGIRPETIDALAIMTDCDDAGGTTTAWYGPIRWMKADQPGD